MEEPEQPGAVAWANEIRQRFPNWYADEGIAHLEEMPGGLSIGQPVRGDVVARAPFGVWVDIGIGSPALLRVVDMADARRRRISFDDYPPVGKTIVASILDFDRRKGEVVLSQQPPLQDDG
jgi:ribosomal protein S1